MSKNYHLRGRFSAEKRSNWLETAGAIAVLAASGLFMAYVFANAMR